MRNIYTVILSLVLTSVSHADLKPYGTLRVDASKDSSGHLVDQNKTASTIGDESIAVNGPDNGTYSMNVRSSTFGVMGSSKGNKMDLDGKVEVEFYGEASSSNAIVNEPQLTYGYIHGVCKQTGLDLVAGQTDDIVSPLNPKMLNHNKGHYQGNAGDFRPQLILGKELFGHLNLQGALGHAWNSREHTGTDASTHLGFNSKDKFKFNLALGAGYLRGIDRVTNTTQNNSRYELPIKMTSVDGSFGMKGFTARGEYYWGQGLDDYNGIGGQITNTFNRETHVHSLKEKGYWLDGSYEWKQFMGVLGYSKAKADRHSLESDISRPAILASNKVKWLGFKWNPYKDFNVGFEYSILTSMFVDSASNGYGTSKFEQETKNERYQLMFSYNI